jgi:uncharacterized protein YxjI
MADRRISQNNRDFPLQFVTSTNCVVQQGNTNMPNEAAEFEYTIRRKVFTFFGAKFHIYNAAGELIGFSKQKAFKLKEDIRVFTDESASNELMSIKARSIIDFSACYDVIDRKSQTSLGALRRKGLSSILRDSWEVLTASDTPVAKIEEDSMGLALLRRFALGNLVPQRFHLADGAGTELARFTSNFNPFVQKLKVAIFPGCPVNPLVVLAAGILLVAIEGRQKG